MENAISYIGEHLWPGRIGHAGILLGFVAALLSALAYFFATQRRDKPEAAQWTKIGRWAFAAHSLGILSVIGMLFYVMTRQYYEYQYVQAHVSDDLPFKYIFAAFWEGQEGSFLLWMFWHIVLGLVLLFKAGKWESPVMSMLALIQVFIGSMILGIYMGWGDDPLKLGSNPTLLLRQVMDAPIFNQVDYVSKLSGNGLNPLLQNYWMTIHPPTLFLGFASTSIPFCFAIAGLWLRKHTEWLQPALPWALFSGAILGTGILMGGAWAYEALSFGGYWAWDPVENMSLVPWLTLIAGIHTTLIAKSTGYSVKSSYAFYLLTFVLIVYSTFLTRSGVLGDTSVHAFTEMGLESQLILFLGFFTLLSLVMFFMRYKGVPAPPKEERITSREFWMFIGTLVLFFSAIIITGSTSLPVYNKIMQFFTPTFQGRVITDPEPHYNKYQLWIAVFIGLLTASAQLLRYKGVNWESYWPKFLRHAGVAVLLALGMSFLTTRWIEVKDIRHLTMLFAGWFAIAANTDYLITFIKGNLKLAGSTFSHIGFGIMLVGILASGLNKRVISSNPFIMDGLIEGADEQSLRNNILLFKNAPMQMGGYEVTYTRDTLDKFSRTYTVNYKKKDQQGQVLEEFELHPNILYDKSFSKVAASNPSTKRYLDRDVFTHIASLPQVEMDMEFRRKREDSLNYKRFDLFEGQEISFLDTVPIRDRDTAVLKRYTVQVESVSRETRHPDYKPEKGDFTVGARLRVQREGDDTVYLAEPMLVLRKDMLVSYPSQINEISAKVRLTDAIFTQLFVPESELGYKEYELTQGDSVRVGDLVVRFAGFNKQPDNRDYQPEKDDIAVSAVLDVRDAAGKTYEAQPVYLIRGSQPFNLKAEVEELGLHARFMSINPEKESASISLALTGKKRYTVPFEIATNSLRSDYIVLEAIEFPGINLFWLGSLLMMVGLAVGMWNRMRSSHA